MKTLKINKIILLLIGLVAFNSCVEDDDFNVPNTAVVQPVISGVIQDISEITGQLAQEQNNFGGELDYDDDETILTFDAEGADIFVEGYVISSDEGGNYFEELILQDAPENPTLGIRVLIDVNPLFIRYEVGRKVYVKLNGLVAAISNGVVTLGPLDGERPGKISAAQENQFIIRDTEVASIVPLPLALEDFTEDKTNLMIEITNVQFNKDEAVNQQLSFASEPGDQFDAERILESCNSSTTRIFATSTFSDFKSLNLPTGSGSMTAVLSRTFFGDDYYVVVNSPEDINFDSVERCDPFDIADFNILFEEDFNNGFANWTVENTSGTREWDPRDFGGEFYARGSAFQSGNILQMTSWLISESFDFDAQDNESLVLEIADAFSNGQPLTAFYSNDYDSGDPSLATWIQIGADEIDALPDNTGFFNNEYDQTNLIDLSGITGMAKLAFVYDSMGATVSTTIDLSDVKIINPM
ncbi:DUF5689 domain-containing protein [Winogradskyella haliclonae]|uniref:DUF5689 domain-containing protein n=1 Tax=Winogradskyella haliclonae TaxID=2048558 RepID=A0ABQ2BW67_9FLAO|nr:DUF5689 domain-containing protein [Winogradskyella haliclonae]GGI56090.1 hypothetical protein GCM10011444_03990 [Winogradskyella haliclonae]